MLHESGEMTLEQLEATDKTILIRWRDELVAIVSSIQTSLGNHDKLNDYGQRMTFQEYNGWRQRAKLALLHRTNNLRMVKAAIHAISDREYEQGNSNDNPKKLKSSWNMLIRLLLPELAGKDIGPLAQSIVDRLQQTLDAQDTSKGGTD